MSSTASGRGTMTAQGPGASANKKEEETSPLVVAAVVAFYFAVSLSLVFLNKYLMNYADFKFPYPLTMTWYQFVVAWACLFLLASAGRNSSTFSFVPPYEFKWDVAKQILRLTLVYLGMILFNNLCLKYVEVSFYQVARSLTIFFSILLPFLMWGERKSIKVLAACVVVVIGFVLGAGGEVNFTWAGLIFGVLSSFFVALYGVMIKDRLPIVDGNEWRLSMYNTPMATVLLLPMIFVSDESTVLSDASETLTRFDFWFWMTIAAVLGFMINIAMFLQVKYTSPLTNTICGTAKAGVQTLLGVAIFQNPVTFVNGLGIFLTLAGSGYYSWIRYQEGQAAKRASAATFPVDEDDEDPEDALGSKPLMRLGPKE